MLRVKFNGAAMRGMEEIIDGATTVRNYVASKGANMEAAFSANGTPISGAQLDCSFNELIDNGIVPSGVVVTIYETLKTANA